MRFIRRYFITGLLILTPITVTAYIFWKVFNSVDGLLDPIQERYPLLDFPGFGFVVIVLVIILTGFFAGNFIGRRIISSGERILNYVPLIRRIYTAVKELSEVFLSDKKTIFRKVVLIRYPHPNSFALAFMTQEASEYFNGLAGRDLVNVFVPTTPNPTSGFLLLIPKDEIIPVRMSVEEGLKMVISGGAFLPPLIEDHVQQTGK